MSNRLGDWANIAQVVSGVAVVATLVFLITEIRENSDITRAAVYADLVDSINALERDIVGDPELSSLWYAYIDQEIGELDDATRRRLNSMVLVVFRNYEKAFFDREYGLIGEREWVRFSRTICFQHERAQGIDFDLTEVAVLTEEFRDYIESSCNGADQ